ncbi:MAG: 5'-deoxyadenosine deaminase [Kofleriaceae bacterium]|nr:5'-deoxyadenosine deaminase [Myxococcales bacterium]MCB9565022.1 5'-deoxyadenosine deaminase [Kofleriaceae bacterium]
MSEVIFRGGTILTVAGSHVLTGDVACRDGVIVHVGGEYTPQARDYDVLDCEGCVIMPGLVQAHVHTCQTLARGRADDLELLDWLRKVVWPYEAALDAPAMAAAARLACAELLLGGTTAVLDMGTVHHTDEVFAAAEHSGLRATIGKAMMDHRDDAIPAGLRESTTASLAESDRLAERWHGAADGRLRYAYAPRFALSCTDDLLREVGTRARDKALRIHTHSSENRAEIAAVRERFGKDNVVYLHDTGLTGDHVTLAHCIHLTDEERAILAATGTHVAHCPSSNLKLASGVALVPELRDAGVPVAIGADGAPCNNNLDGFLEMRLAAILHKPRVGPRALPASEVLRMATLGGAAAIGLADQIGTLEVGKRGDVVAVAIDGAHVAPTANPYSAVVYACRASDVRHVAVDGAVKVRDRRLLTLDVADVVREGRKAASRIFAAMG